MKTIRSLFNVLAVGAALVTVPACVVDECQIDTDCTGVECEDDQDIALCGPPPKDEGGSRRCKCYMDPVDADAE